jgi:hypothetical protein
MIRTRTPKLPLAALGVFAALFVFFVLPQGGKAKAADGGNTAAQAAYAVTAPAIDGVVDAVWDAATAYYANDHYDNTHAVPLATGFFKVLWDEDNLYLLAVITDSTIAYHDAVNFWVSETDTRYFAYGLSPGDWVVVANPYGMTGYYKGNTAIEDDAEVASVIGEGGYTVEVRVPFYTGAKVAGHGAAINFSVDEYYPADEEHRVDYCNWNGDKGYDLADPTFSGYYWDGPMGLRPLAFLAPPTSGDPETPDPKKPKGCASATAEGAAFFSVLFVGLFLLKKA